jgi:CHAT domain-containing protein/tetratricopeptide (TPR) repeat protein
VCADVIDAGGSVRRFGTYRGRGALAFVLALLACSRPTAAAGEEIRAAAERAFDDGERLAQQRQADSRRQAFPRYEEALTGWRSLGDADREAATLDRIGLLHYELSEPKKAEAAWRETLAIRRRLGDCRGQAQALNDVGEARRAVGDTRGAVPIFEEALALARDANDLGNEATLLHNLAAAYAALGEPRKALATWDRALPLLRAAGDLRIEASALRASGSVRLGLGDVPQALTSFEEVREMKRILGDAAGEAVALVSIGDVYSENGRPDIGETYLREALRIDREIGNRKGEALCLADLGHAFHVTRDLPKARGFYEQALVLFREVGDRQGEASELAALGSIARAEGEPRRALELLEPALAIQREIGDRATAAASLLSVAALYQNLGDAGKSLARCAEARALQRQMEDRRGEARTLDVVGNVELGRGNKSKARSSFAEALSIQRAAEDRLGAIESLCGLGFADLGLARPREALTSFEEAVSLAEAANERRGRAIGLTGVGMARLALGERAAALEILQRALPAARSSGNRLVEASALTQLARAERALGRLEEADAHAAEAIARHEDVRRAVTGDDLRASFLATVRDAYELRLDILVRLHGARPLDGFARRAFDVSEAKRARGLLDLLRERSLDAPDGVSPDLLAEARAARSRLQAKASARVRLLAAGKDAEASAALRDLDALAAALDDAEERIRRESPRYASLTAAPLGADAVQRTVLDPDTLLLEYAIGDERSTLFALTPTSLSVHRLPGRAVLTRAARSVYAAWSRNGAREPKAAGELARMLLDPVRGLLGHKRILVVADEALQYVPFAALSLDGEPLVEKHEIAYAPSASSLAALRQAVRGRASAPKTVAVFADPVFDARDGRVRGARSVDPSGAPDGDLTRSAQETGLRRFDRLRGTREEAEAITALAGPGAAWMAVDFAASREAAVSGRLRAYGVVHFATHALLNSRHPELSGIVLSLVDDTGRPVNGFLQLHEIYGLRLGADIAVLSACQTALGRDVAGEGLVGLVRGFMYAGVPRVVASLWRVSDKATAELMTRFYAALLRGREPASKALRSAQRALREDPRFASPHHWAAFTLEGEWR